ncbi:cardiomyopathy-associated protein 5-like [Lethenteron reissneri]|uniref:cardiomyopathy-associated protein 5-like n=1 Tax=Lethenteron reissneri TaxID=7753 RepID=UPI002AB700C1|nr:cardiomyopathy-associated protein 5-like [Lethenteron reissneri]
MGTKLRVRFLPSGQSGAQTGTEGAVWRQPGSSSHHGVQNPNQFHQDLKDHKTHRIPSARETSSNRHLPSGERARQDPDARRLVPPAPHKHQHGDSLQKPVENRDRRYKEGLRELVHYKDGHKESLQKPEYNKDRYKESAYRPTDDKERHKESVYKPVYNKDRHKESVHMAIQNKESVPKPVYDKNQNKEMLYKPVYHKDRYKKNMDRSVYHKDRYKESVDKPVHHKEILYKPLHHKDVNKESLYKPVHQLVHNRDRSTDSPVDKTQRAAKERGDSPNHTTVQRQERPSLQKPSFEKWDPFRPRRTRQVHPDGSHSCSVVTPGSGAKGPHRGVKGTRGTEGVRGAKEPAGCALSKRSQEEYAWLTERLGEQGKKCRAYSGRCSQVEHSTEAARFEEMAEQATRLQVLLEMAQRQGAPPPTHTLTRETLHVPRVNPDLAAGDLLVTVFRGHDLCPPSTPGVAKHGLHAFVKIEVPLPCPKASQREKTGTQSGTCPEFNESFKFTLQRGSLGPLGSEWALGKLCWGFALCSVAVSSEGRAGRGRGRGGRRAPWTCGVRARSPLGGGWDLEEVEEEWLQLNPVHNACAVFPAATADIGGGEYYPEDRCGCLLVERPALTA